MAQAARMPDGNLYDISNLTEEQVGNLRSNLMVKMGYGPKQEEDPGILDAFGRGLSRGIDQTSALVGDALPAIVADSLGYDDYRDEQLKEYTKVFRVFFAKNISSRLRNYSDQNIEVVGSKKISNNYVMVKSKMISKTDSQKIQIDWRVFKVKDKLVIRDLVVEGLSLAKTQREEFNSILSSKGYDSLIISLKDFISKN